ncbi:macro domain-containing protein [Enterococcus cecorum]|uniref:macro domain-containing protein n=1 Tax=Enterococcus cecorum TaxID=44008 RepID=UPI0022D32123|nr:macro domain-containing protein [Enterococcus cecorum]CAI3438751.1 macro domain-containing protein [Enterococcus cecorum]CAI3442735.1 macro domain-containing protein [Enterococcus cecorum]CAI3507968.1 macro domain-containing protein [Enterococcus cecorum]
MFNQMNINVNAPNEKLNIEIRLVDKHFEYSFSRLAGLYTYHSGVVDEQKSQEWLQEIRQVSLVDWPVLPEGAGPEIKQKNKWNVEFFDEDGSVICYGADDYFPKTWGKFQQKVLDMIPELLEQNGKRIEAVTFTVKNLNNYMPSNFMTSQQTYLILQETLSLRRSTRKITYEKIDEVNQRTYYEFERHELGQLLNSFQLVFATQNSRGKEEGRKVHDSDVYLKIELIDGTFEEYYWGLHQMFFTPGWKELVDAIHDLMLQGSTFLGHIFTSLPHLHKEISQYIYALVEIEETRQQNYYVVDNLFVHEGDYVVVPVGNRLEEKIARILRLEYCNLDNLPQPLELTRKILRKSETVKFARDLEDDSVIDNRQIDLALETIDDDPSIEETIGLIEAIRQNMNLGGEFVLPVHPLKTKQSHHNYHLGTKDEILTTTDGQSWALFRLFVENNQEAFVAFTNVEEFEKDGHTKGVVYPISSILEMVAKTPNINGIMLNPYGRPSFLAKELIMTIFMRNQETMKRSQIYLEYANVVNLTADSVVNNLQFNLNDPDSLDYALRTKIGTRLVDYYDDLMTLRPGEVKVTPGFGAKTKYIFHTVIPKYQQCPQADECVISSYYESLNQARKLYLKQIVLPIFGFNDAGYPLESLMPLIINTITQWMTDNRDYVLHVYLSTEDFEVYSAFRDYLEEA